MNRRDNDWNGMEVAVVGMAGRFPGARNVEEFWQNLRAGKESITHFSAEELLRYGDREASIANPNYVRVGRIIEDDDQFDAALFGYSPREAELVDPQQRLFLECAWEALEHAGYDTERFGGLVGVYSGIKLTTYLWNIYSNPALLASVGELNAQIANDRDYVATRVSYKLGLGGPSINVQSACSTSLVAVHLACQGLLAGEADMAIAGGVSVRTQQIAGYTYREGDILSPDGRIRSFDAEAKGTIFGSGLGAVVLRRLEDALADGDRIWGVIRGTAINNDGAVKVGFTAPGADGQERVIRAAHSVAELNPETISYIEAHGTGTLVGDPIEVTALTRAFRAKTDKRGFCAIGSVKTNIGHLASAAGIAGLIKTLLALDREELPASINFERPNPQIDFESSPFFVQDKLTPWPRAEAPRRAGISAFGIGGTNAHAIVEEAPDAEPSGPSRPWQLLLLSARTESALAAQTGRLLAHLESAPDLPLPDVAYTLAVGRRQLEHRRALVCRDRADAIEVLQGGDAKRPLTSARETGAPQLAFLFSGQGSQHVGMFADLYREEPTFRAEIDRCAEILRPHFSPPLDLCEVLYPTPERRSEAEALLAETRLTQPALFVVEWALARQLGAWGIEPQAMLGHSIGEYVAACLAGVFSLEDALALVAARGRLMQAVPPGAMLTVSLPAKEVEALLAEHPDLSLAATNAPKRSVVAGPFAAIEALEAALAARGTTSRRLHTSHAFHSSMMEPALAPFRAELSKVAFSPPSRPYVSNVTGTWITEAQATDPEYWVRHLRGTVRFAEGLATLFAESDRALVEVGPATSLAQLARQHPDRGTRPVIAAARQPKEEQDDQAVLLGALGQLWMAGVAIDQPAFYAGETRRRAVLPTYPFERRRFYIDPANDMLAALSAQSGAKRLGFEDWFYVPYWKPSSPALPRPAAELLAELSSPRWLLFADEAGLVEALAGRLREAGAEVAVAAAGPEYRELAPDRFEIDPGRPEDYDRLLEALAAGVGLPARIVHGFAVGGDSAAPDERVRRSFYSLLHLAQALGRQRLAERVELAVVATGLFRARGDEVLTPEKATLLGPCKVVPQENPMIAARAIDVEWPAGPGAETALDRLLAEICDRRADVGVALRGDRRHVQAWEPLRLDRTLEARLPFVDRGVYLITGGFGGVGLSIAESLAVSCRARLVLTGRSPLPPRESWEGHLAAQAEGEGDAQSRAIRAVLRLEELGAEVLVARADVSNPEEMRAAVEAARGRFGADAKVRGVVHAAGLPGGGVVQLKDPKVAAAVLAPKLAGARVLEEVLAGEPLDFFVVCSSTIAIYGNFGQVDYCAANSFLDAFAEDLAGRRGIQAVSINYGAWRDVGMAVHARVPTAAAASAAETVPAGPRLHPLVHVLAEDGAERKVFLSRLTPGDLWVIDEHLVAKSPAVPGTGCLEMARAAFALAYGPGPVELSDVYFLTPLMVPAGQVKEARVTLEPGKDGVASFRIASRAAGEGKWQEHAFGKAKAGSEELGRRDLAALRRQADLRTDEVTEKLLDNREGLVWWGPRWQSLKRVHVGEGQALARLELPDEFAADLASTPLHPALVDVATAIVGLLEEGSHLPFSYRRLAFSGRLPTHLWSAIRRREDPTSETVTADVTLLDDEGRVAVEIEGFTLKTVGAAAARLETQAGAPEKTEKPQKMEAPAAAAEASNASAAAPAKAGGDVQRDALLAQSGMSPAEGVEAFRRILAARAGRQVAVSPRDLKVLLDQMQRARVQGPGEAAAAATVVRAAHPRSVQTPFVEPGTETEKVLGQIWQKVLGIESIGIDDNFYEMGGDSVLGIQIVAAAREAGIDLQSAQLFEHQTLRELGKALGGRPSASTASAATEGVLPFALAGLDPERLRSLLGDRAAEDAYPLSPLQQGFLFDTLAAGKEAVYLEQLTCTLIGEIDTDALARAWQSSVDRHPSLRTWFAWDDLDRPLQIVAAEAPLPIAFDDLREVPAEQRGERVEALRKLDRETPFDLSRAPLMRLRMIRTDERTWEVAWSHHHLLMDGWSSPMLVVETLRIYENLLRGETPNLPATRPFRDYIAWLLRRSEGDAGSSEAFFRRYLGGFSGPTPLAADRPEDAAASARADFLRLNRKMDGSLDARVRDAAKNEQTSLSIVVATAWALLLAQEAGTDDVVYGVSVSGRPPELPGVEQIVGCFINALPVRARFDRTVRVGDWLRAFQVEQAELISYSYAPLVEAQRAAGLPADRGLFATAFEFWNFPYAEAEGERSFEMHMAEYDVSTNMPLSLRAIPLEGLELQLTYDRRRFDAATIEHKLGKLETALAALASAVERPETTLGEVLESLAALDRERTSAAAASVSDVAREKLKARRRPAPSAV